MWVVHALVQCEVMFVDLVSLNLQGSRYLVHSFLATKGKYSVDIGRETGVLNTL